MRKHVIAHVWRGPACLATDQRGPCRDDASIEAAKADLAAYFRVIFPRDNLTFTTREI